jgi:DNA-binding NarL/FixJ family response regulator
MAARRTRPKAAARKLILLIDDHALMRRGLGTLIESEPDLRICAEAATRRAGLDAIVSTQPDLVIADLSLKDSDGLELIRDIKQRFPALPVLALSMHDEVIYAERALRAGACGYVSKQELDETVLTAIRRLLAGEMHTSEAMSRHLARKFVTGTTLDSGANLEQLTDRELEVFTLIGRGRKTTEIAQYLFLSVKTIESHRERLKTKLGLASGADLVRCATLWVESGRIS